MFKIAIDNQDTVIAQTKSQAGQDLFVVAMLQGKKNGTFLEIGSGHPIWVNNTWLLEHYFDFTGDSIDNVGLPYRGLPGNSTNSANSINSWKKNRPKTNFHNCDALNFDYRNLSPHYDYLQIDIDPPMAHLTLLEKLIPAHEFSVITFEHDIWRMTDEVKFVQKKSREFLEAHNYTLLVDDVTIHPEVIAGMGLKEDRVLFFEDWYVNKKFIGQDIIDAYQFIAPMVVKYYPDILFEKDVL